MTTDRHEALIAVDGAVLGADYMLPAGDGPFPVAISMYPYRKDDIIGSLFLAPRMQLAKDGIATLLVDMRGHGASGGEPGVSYDLGGIEGQDTAEVVEWAAAQPWCNGGVGIWGVSYGGMTALAAAARRPPHLRAIYAVYASDDTHRDWVAPGGNCPMAFGNYLWSSHMFGLDLCPPSRQDPEGNWRRIWQERLDRMQTRPGHAFEWRKHRADTDYWSRRALDASKITVPTFMVEGWHDFFTDGAVRTYEALNCEKRMVMGPWLHVCPDLVDREPYDWVGEMSRWFTRYLNEVPGDAGEPQGATSSSTLLFVEGPQVWRRYETWPPPEAQEAIMHPHADGSLDSVASTGAGEARYNPTVVTGRDAGMLDPLGTGFGHPGDQHSDDLASLRFDTSPLAEPLEIAGNPAAVLALRDVETPDLRLTVRFCDVGEDGYSALLTTGWLRVSEQLAGTSAATVTVHGGPVAAVLAAGHRLRVSVSSVDFPRAWPTPGPAGFALGLGQGDGTQVIVPVLADVSVGASHEAEVPRPQAAPRPDWVNSGAVRYLVTEEEPRGVLEAVLLNEAVLAPPSGARMTLDERFTARAAADDLTTARVGGNVNIGLNLAGGERVQVHVETEFGETTAWATGSVSLDGKTIFDRTWVYPET
jgi:putative CocE/NonD family hydrolase